MTSVQERSLSERLRAHRRNVVIELCARRGPQWNRIAALRGKWGITADAAIPPERSLGDFHEPWSLVGWTRPSSAHSALIDVFAWNRDVGALVLAAVPEDLRLGARPANPETFPLRVVDADYERGRPLWSPWAIFLSGCVLYDPPCRELERFSDHAAFLVPRTVADPIVQVSDPVEAARVEQERREVIMDALLDRIGGEFGDGIRSTVDRWYRELLRATDGPAWDMHRQNAPRRLIDPLAGHTLDDLGQAIRMMRTPRPDGQRGKGLGRDPLVAVQCAILRVKYDAEWSEIGRRYGWDLQPSHHNEGKPRCKVASDYVNEGRRILGMGPPPRGRPTKTSSAE